LHSFDETKILSNPKPTHSLRSDVIKVSV
jgi:hypothetical protein